MITTLRDTKTRLSKYVKLVENGEDVIITVRGKPKARLTAITQSTTKDRNTWAKKLTKLQNGFKQKYDSSAQIVSKFREDRF